MTRRLDLAGTWPALAGDVLVYALGSSVLAERVTPAGALEPIAAKPTPEPLMFLAAALSPAGDLAIVGKGQQSGVVFLITAAGVDALGPSHGNRPCAIAWDGAGFVIRWVIRPGMLASIVHGERLPDAPIPAPWTGTATGLLDLDAHQQPIWMDAARTRTVGGWTFTEPIQRGAVIVGQGDPPGVYVSPDGTSVFQALADPMAESPGLSLLPHGRILACAYTTHGASLAILDPPYPPAVSPAPPPPVTPPPVEPPMPIPNQLAVVQRVRASYPTPLGAQQGACLVALAHALGHGAGLLLKPSGAHVTLPGGQAVAQDIIAFPDGSIFDVFADAEGAASPTWTADAPVDPARYLDVSGITLGQSSPSDPPPSDDEADPPPAGDPRVGPLLAQITTLTARVTALETQIATLHALTVEPGHAVSVTGSVSIADVVTARRVTWTGAIL